jgi:thioester reductase-like protein
MIGGHSKTGVWNAADFMAAIVKGCIQLGAAPILNSRIAMSPVDFVSAAIVGISKQPDLHGKVFHLSSPHVIDTGKLVAWINARGYFVRPISFRDWLDSLLALGSALQNNAIYPFLALMVELNAELQHSIGLGLDEIRMPRYDCMNTTRALEHTSIRCPVMDERLFDTYLSHLIKEQFLARAVAEG